MKKILLLILAFASTLQASDVIPSVYSTGINDYYGRLNTDSIDFHYLVRSPENVPSYTYAVDPQVIEFDPSGSGQGGRDRWLDPSGLSPTAKWISFGTNPKLVDNRPVYEYETYFNIDRFDINSVVVSGQMGSSAGSSVYLNGNYLFSNYPTEVTATYRNLTDFSFSNSSGFLLPGINKLTFEISNGYPSRPGFRPPNGLLVSMSGVGNIVPEPSTYILSGIGCLILLLARKNKGAK